MMILKKAASALLIAALLSTSMAPAAMAAKRDKVGRINLTIDSDIRSGWEGGDIEVNPTGDNTDRYSIDSWEIINDEGDAWRRSNPPIIKIYLVVEDEEEYYFSGTSSGSFKLTLGDSSKSHFDRVKYLDATTKDNQAFLTLKIQLVFDDDADISTPIAPSGLQWDDTNNGIASWNQIPSAKYYQVQLMKDGSVIGEIYNPYDAAYNFASHITVPGAYQFKVRSIKASNNAKSSWTISSSWNVSEAGIQAMASTTQASTVPAAAPGSGKWEPAADGVRWWWSNPDGTFPASAWKEINGKWYYFDAEGYMATGWITVDGKSYYLDPATGAMYANARTPDNCWVDAAGAWVPGA